MSESAVTVTVEEGIVVVRVDDGRANAHARIYSPREAVDAGYLDEVVPPALLGAAAMAKATALGALKEPAYKLTKRSALKPTLRLIRDTLEEDMDKVG